jgi:hypothetical protein
MWQLSEETKVRAISGYALHVKQSTDWSTGENYPDYRHLPRRHTLVRAIHLVHLAHKTDRVQRISSIDHVSW